MYVCMYVYTHYYTTLHYTTEKMKNRLNISLDDEIIDRLRQEENYSDIVNRQLKEYYLANKIENIERLNQKLINLKAIHKQTNREMREIKAQIKKIKDKEALVLEKFKSRSELIKVIEDRRERIKQNPYRRVEFMTTAEEEADHILKGGKRQS